MTKVDSDELPELNDMESSTNSSKKAEISDPFAPIRAWLPFQLSNLTSTQIALLLLAIIFLLASRVQLSVLTLFGGFVVGYIYAVPSNQLLDSPILSKFNSLSSENSLESSKVDLQEDEALNLPIQLNISPQIDGSLNRFFDCFIRDFIQYWFDPLNISKSQEFETSVRNSLNTAALNFTAYARGDNVDLSLLLIYCISNTLIVHVREYRQFEASALPLDKYLLENPQSPFNQLYDHASQVNHLQKLSKILLTRLLPKKDAASPCLITLLTEIATTSTIEPTLEAFSDPDRINQLIISIFKTEERHTLPSNNNEQQLEYERLKACGDKVLRVKVVEARQIYHTESYGLYCTLIFGKTKCKTKYVKPDSNPLWGDSFNLSWSEQLSKGTDGITLELYGRVMFPKDVVIGKACVSREEIVAKPCTRSWFSLQSASKSEPCGEVLLEIDIIDVAELASSDASQERGTMDEVDEEFIQKNPLSLDDVLRNDKGFLEFMQFMEDIQAPPFLQFWMNAESFLQSSANSNPDLMKQDAEMIFKLHLSDEAKHRVPIDPNILEEITREIQSGNVTSKCFARAQMYVFDVMESPFFREFRYSDLFKKYCLDMRFIENNRESYADRKSDEVNNSTLKTEVEPTDPEGTEIDSSSNQLRLGNNDCRPPVSNGSNDLSQVKITQLPTKKQGEEIYDYTIKRCKSVASLPTSDKEKLNSKIATADTNQESSRRSRSMSDITTTQIARDSFKNAPVNNDTLAKVEEKVSNEGVDQEEDGGGMKFLTAAITSLREQLIVTEDLIEQTPSKESSKLKSLTHNRDDLQRQVDQLVGMARDFAEEEDVGRGIIDLKGIVAKVSDASKRTSIGPNLVQSLASGKSLLFVIELERSKSSGGWMITRNFTDFANLHSSLREQFPKVDKITFPTRPRFASKANNQKLCVELEKYLSMLLSDMLLCESKPLQTFLEPDSVIATNENRDIADEMLDAFKSAANLVKIPFVDTHKANIFRSKTEVASPSSIRSLNDETASPRNASFESYMYTDESILSKPPSSDYVASKAAPKLSNSSNNSSSGTANALESSSSNPKHSLHPESSQAGAGTDSECSSTLTDTHSDWPTGQLGSSAALPSENSQLPPQSSKSSLKETSVMDQPIPVPSRNNSVQSVDLEKATLKDLSVDEVDVLIETFFALVEETFDMAERKQWLRRKALNVLKQILRQSYGKTINRAFLDYLDKTISEENIVRAIDVVTDTIWPDGVWPQELPKAREDDEKQAAKIEAKVLFVNNVPDAIIRMVGEYNAAQGVTRLFNMLQYKDLTKALLIKILEAWVKLVFSEERNK